MNPDIPVIAIDGPGGTGKGTVSGHLANWLGWHFLDSGALYRVLAIAAKQQRIGAEQPSQLEKLASQFDVVFKRQQDGETIFLNNQDVTADVRNEVTGNDASVLARIPEVRAGLLERQHQFRQPPGLVADGRDMGTVVFPDAQLKIFMTASVEERARRRYKQLKQKGFDVNLARLSVEITERDNRDSQRTVSPLRPASDAVTIDTTDLDINEVILRISDLVRARFPDSPELPIR